MREHEDLTPYKYGKLTPIKYLGKSRWRCLCDCGISKSVRADALKYGLVKSCGCLRPGRFKDLTGMTFGRLKVIEEVQIKKGQSYWRCLCDCGNEHITAGANLRSGGTISCGCYAKEVTKIICGTHLKSSHPLYSVWRKMIQRCENPCDSAYKMYGGRGIKVSDRWKDVNNFIEDMSSGYAPELYLDRIDVNGDYTPENCRWVNASMRAYNRRKLKGKSNYHGVYFHPVNKRWVSYVTDEGKMKYLGSFDSEQEAAKVYNAAAKEIYGQDAKLNNV